MRTLRVIHASKLIERALLFDHGGGRRARHFILQRSMHPLVPTVLLRMARLDSLRRNAKPDPPHGQCGEPTDAWRCERRPVVGADSRRQSKLSKRSLEVRSHGGIICFGKSLAFE